MAACAKLAFITGRPPFFSHLYNGNDWRPVVDKGIPAFTQKPSLGVGAGVYPPSLASSSHKGSAVRAHSSNSFWSSAENAFACSLSISIVPTTVPFEDARWARSFPKACRPRRSNSADRFPHRSRQSLSDGKRRIVG